jgi:apolipoprotein N-acyltransferase
LVDVPAQHSSTVYQYLGDWFAWVAMAMLVLMLVITAAGRR